MELEFLRQEVERLKKAKGEVKSIKDLFNQETDENEDSKNDKGSENDSGESEEDDYIDDLPEDMMKKKQDMRTSVSAEAFGVWNKKGDFQPPHIPKTQQQKEALKKRLE